jgi:CubicO group peptidase (beta-lactamase class C family)
MKKNILIPLLSFLSIFTATSQDFAAAELDSLFLVLEENDRFMGSLAIAHIGEPVYAKAIGYADVLEEKKTDTATKFRIGSISKTFTAALIFKAIENDKLNLEDTISKYFPNVPNANSITISNLLNHRSGIYNFTNNPLYLSWNTTAKSKEELLKIIIGGGSVFEPDSKADYSNSNYVLLTFILETIFKKSYPTLIAEHITEPLQLNSTYFGGKIAIVDNEANSYQYTKGWEKQTETDMSVPLGAGSIVSNPTDLNTFMKALFDGDIISKESLATMITLKENYGMGIFQVPFGKKKGYGHTGGIDGFSSVAYYFPEDEVSISLTSNGNRFRNNDIIIAGLSAFYGMPISIPSFESVQLTSEQLESFIGVYSSQQFPLKITITQEKGTLYGQATGQPSFPLDAKPNDIFEFLPAGVQLEFQSSENTMTLKQGGGNFSFTKEE